MNRYIAESSAAVDTYLDTIRSMQPDERLIYWIHEREKVHCRKDQGLPAPWTYDPIIQRYRFCNIRRMDDKVSKWLLDYWYVPNYGHKNIILACVLARYINEPASLEAIGFPRFWTPRTIKEILWERRFTGTKVFNPAYVIPAGHIAGEGKIDTVITRVCEPIHRNPPNITGETMKEAVEAMKGCYGLSSFLGGQVVADLRWAMPGAWRDKSWWAPMGPGSKRGMNRLHGRPLDAKITQSQFVEELGAVIAMCAHRLATSMTARLEAMDYQNCLCEYDKYCRALFKEGTPKQRYQGVGE